MGRVIELLLASLWIIGLNLTVLLPVALLAAVGYRWNVVLLALVHDREAHAGVDLGRRAHQD